MVNNLIKNRKILFTAFAISLLFKPLWLFNVSNLGQPADDTYHWIHATTIAFDLDLNYLNDYNHPKATLNQETNVPSAPPGAGYLSSPFVFLFSLFDLIGTENLDSIRENPVKSFSYLGYFTAGLFYTLLSFFMLKKILPKNKYNYIILFCAFVGTLVHFVTTRFLMPHAVEFFLCTTIFYIFKYSENKLSNFELLSLYTVYFLLSLTRPSTFLYYLILFLIFRKKFQSSKSSITINFSFIIFYFYIYTNLSQTLYKANYILLNTYGSDMDAYKETINVQQILSGLIKFPNLMFSPSMGLIWAMPIVFFGILIVFKILSVNKNVIYENFLYLLFFGSSLVPLYVWQGREVAYGQRLLIGLIPISVVLISENIKTEKFFKNIFIVPTIISYIGYLFFYSSKKLTLFEGVTLWGTNVGFVGENYFFLLFTEMFKFDNLVSVLLNNLYAVSFFRFFNLNKLTLFNSIIESFDPSKVGKFLTYAEIYGDLRLSYLFCVVLLTFGFSFLFAKIISD